jgi:hypothetical protein
MPVERNCDFCGHAYRRPQSNVGKFCSKRCAYDARRVGTPSRYRMVYAPGHPLAPRSPYVPEHRLLMWNQLGPGSHPCHYCGRSLAWRPGEGVGGDALVIDHLDRDPSNNKLGNLVASCTSCNLRNAARTVDLDEPYIERSDGSRTRAVGRICEECGETFLIPASALKRPNRGRFCSPSCARKQPRGGPKPMTQKPPHCPTCTCRS